MNPFPEPSGDDKEYMLKFIKDRMGSPGGLTFHGLLDHIENLISSGFKSRSQAAAYYMTNVLNNNKSLSDTDKADIVSGIREQIDSLQ